MRNINDANRLTRIYHSHKHHHLYSHNILTIGLCVKVTQELRQWCDSVPPSRIFEKSATLVQGPVLIKTLASLAIYSCTRCVYILMQPFSPNGFTPVHNFGCVDDFHRSRTSKHRSIARASNNWALFVSWLSHYALIRCPLIPFLCML